MDAQCMLYTVQLMVPIENCGTYTFTFTVEDIAQCEGLSYILDSIEWTV